LKSPNEEKYRRVSKDSKALLKALETVKDLLSLFHLIGFQENQSKLEFQKEKEGYLNLSYNGLMEAFSFLFPPPIRFSNYGTAKYAFLSNFTLSPFTFRDKDWKTVVHFYEASKFRDQIYEEEIRVALTPEDAIDLVKNISEQSNPGFDKAKKKVMLQGLWCKFKQNEEMKNDLIATGNAELMYVSNNEYWGIGKEGKGKNFLGKILMDVRHKMRTEQKPIILSSSLSSLTSSFDNNKFEDKGKEENN